MYSHPQELTRSLRVPSIGLLRAAVHVVRLAAAGATVFTAAVLVFLVQPIAARIALPAYGGSAGVWSVSVAAFQTFLLIGYAYAVLLERRARAWRAIGHGVSLLLLAAAASIRPEFFDAVPPSEHWPPAAALFIWLTTRYGPLFVLLSATSPLVQSFLSDAGLVSRMHVYRYYALSNLGSLIGLLAFPFYLESQVSLDALLRLWLAGTALVGSLLCICGAGVLLSHVAPEAHQDDDRADRRRARWFWYSALPSALLVAVTARMCTDIAAVPLLWVLPLTAFLLTYIIVFSVEPRRLRHSIHDAAMLAALALLALCLVPLKLPIVTSIGLHLGGFSVLALAAHTELARSRPSSSRTSQFYLTAAAGGAAGSVATGVLLPLAASLVPAGLEGPLAISQWFAGVSVPEYVALLVTFGLALGRRRAPELVRWLDRRERTITYAASAIGSAFALSIALRFGHLQRFCAHLVGTAGDALAAIIWFGVPVAFFYRVWRVEARTRWVGAGPLVLWVVWVWALPSGDAPLVRLRNFYGTLTVRESPDRSLKLLYHGTTLHGAQRNATPGASHRAEEPLTYYGEESPAKDVLQHFASSRSARIGVIGLGAGTLASYARPGDSMTFLEIDPGVVRLTREGYFSFVQMARARGAAIDIVLSDGRLGIDRFDRQSLDLIVVDAFSSDAVPVHLLTAEAVGLLLERVRDGGLVAFHISNRYFDLEPPLSNIAASVGAIALCARNRATSGPASQRSHWLVVGNPTAHGESPFSALLLTPDARPFRDPPHGNGLWRACRVDDSPIWTDRSVRLFAARKRVAAGV